MSTINSASKLGEGMREHRAQRLVITQKERSDIGVME